MTELKSLKRLHIDGTKIFKKGSTVIKLKSLERSHSDGAKKWFHSDGTKKFKEVF